MNINFTREDTPTVGHLCTAHREGEWIVYTCPHCPTYERRIHLPTGHMLVQGGSNPHIQHQGSFSAVALNAAVVLPN